MDHHQNQGDDGEQDDDVPDQPPAGDELQEGRPGLRVGGSEQRNAKHVHGDSGWAGSSVK